LLIRLLPDPPQPTDPGRPLYLETAALDSATVALANATRESLRMADMVQGMLKNSLEAFRTQNRDLAAGVSAADRAIRQLGSAIRGYLVAIGSEQTHRRKQFDGIRSQATEARPVPVPRGTGRDRDDA